MFETLDVSTDGPIGALWLDRPSRRNALSTRTLADLALAAATPGMEGVARAVYIKARGRK